MIVLSAKDNLRSFLINQSDIEYVKLSGPVRSCSEIDLMIYKE